MREFPQTEGSRIEMVEDHRLAIRGVAEVLQALQDIPEEFRFLKDRITSNLLWVVTEYKPGTKHKIEGVRWRTPAAHELVKARDTKLVRHEHVVERKWMVQFLHDNPPALTDALWNYPACLVTRDEHIALGASSHWGWQRYLNAGLEVIDATTEAALSLEEADKLLRRIYEELGATLTNG